MFIILMISKLVALVREYKVWEKTKMYEKDGGFDVFFSSLISIDFLKIKIRLEEMLFLQTRLIGLLKLFQR